MKSQLIEQAMKDVANDIGQMLCVLAGNLMIENREAGYLLAHQLQPIMDYIKTKYLPEEPRNETVESILNRQRQEAKIEGLKEMADGINEAYEEHKDEEPYEFAKAVIAMAIEKLEGVKADAKAD